MSNSASQNTTSKTKSPAPPHLPGTKKSTKPTSALPHTSQSPSGKASVTGVSNANSNKQSLMIELMRRPSGASMRELITVSGWQAHSIRGVISGSLRKKLGLVVTRFKSDRGDTSYRIDSSKTSN